MQAVEFTTIFTVFFNFRSEAWDGGRLLADDLGAENDDYSDADEPERKEGGLSRECCPTAPHSSGATK